MPAVGTPRVLVADDEPAVRAALDRALRLEGYEVLQARDGEEALAVIAEEHPDAAVLDVRMPRLDGLSVCRRLRRSGDRTPLLVLTAKDAVEDRVAGLDAGADDYLAKPFSLEELLARLRALLRRTSLVEGGPVSRALRYDDLELDPDGWLASRNGEPLELTRTEFQLLLLFLEHPEQVLPRAVILRRVWGFDFGPTSNALEVYVGYLRRKTEAGGRPRLIQTVRGVGYVLRRS